MLAGGGRKPPAVIGTHNMAARHDPFCQIAAAVHAASLHCEVTVTIDANDHLGASNGNRNHIPRLKVTNFRHSMPSHDPIISFLRRCARSHDTM